MTTTRRFATAIALLALPLSASADGVGFVAGIDGQVGVRPAETQRYAPGAVDQGLRLDDAVRTDRDSYAKLVLLDDSVLSMGEETVLVLDALAVGPKLAAGGRSIVRQLGGQLRTTLGEAFGGPTRLEIHTPTATIGVKGTVVDTRTDGETTLACVERGEVSVRSSDPDIGDEVEIPEGMCRFVRAGEAPGPALPPPADFTPLGPGPSGVGGADLLADQLLRDDTRQQHYGWLGGAPPVAAGPDDAVPSYAPPVHAFDDALDAILGSSGFPSSGAGGGGPPIIGGGEAPGDGPGGDDG